MTDGHVEFSYQWIVKDADINGCNGRRRQEVKVSFTDDADNEETLTSVATEAVAAKPNSEATGLPTVTGTPQVDETLTASTSAINDEDGLEDVFYSHQWISSDGNNDTDIPEVDQERREQRHRYPGRNGHHLHAHRR